MTGFFTRGSKLERELCAGRPRPSDEFVSRIEGRIRSEGPARVRRSFRVAVPVAITAVMLGALAAVGGVGYAATSVGHAVSAVTHVFAPAKAHVTLTIAGKTSGGDQYQPGFEFGAPDVNHDGPPVLTKPGGEFAPPLTPKIVGKTALISTNFTIDEQAHLFISVIDKKTGKELLITQTKSKLGSKLNGVQTKSINYLALVPRKIPIKLAVPLNLLTPGGQYAIRIIARDPQGNKKTLLLPFNA